MNKTVVIAREIVANAVFMVPRVASWRVQRGRTIGGGSKKFDAQFARLLPHLGELSGATVLEIGPGDVIPMAWLLMREGAERYVAVDRFGGDITSETARQCYRELGAPKGFPDAQVRDGTVEYRVIPAEDPTRFPRDVDLAVSVNVFEHVTDVYASFASIFKALRPGGRMVHIIDLSPHGAWRQSENPMEFLTVAEPLWRAMGSRRGLPNRFRLPDFVRDAERAGFVVGLVEPKGDFTDEQIRQARPKLTPRLRAMTDEELRPRGLLMVADKPED